MDLYFASSGNKDMESLLEKKHCNRLFTQLEKSSIKRCIEMKTRRNPSKLFIDSGAFTSWTDVLVVVQGEHSCMTARGIKSRGAKTRTATIRGEFNDNVELRKEAYSLMNLN